MKRYILILFILIFFLFNCPINNNSENTNSGNSKIKSNSTRYHGIEAGFPTVQDSNVYFDNLKNETNIDFVHDSVSFSIKINYPDYYNQKLAIFNLFYPMKNTQLFLTITSPINTTIKDMPLSLENREFDDPDVINEFKNLIDDIFLKISNTDLVGIVVGNEVDIYLSSHTNEIDNFKNFFISIKNYIKTKDPELPVSFCSTLEGVTTILKNDLIDIYNSSDVVTITYYPDFGSMQNNPGVVQTDFNEICSIYNKKIYFQECGYPSSEDIGCSELQQSVFITKVFESWDIYKSKIEIISFYESFDMSAADANDYMTQLGINDPDFLAFLTSLGLKTNLNVNKKAYKTLVDEINKRNW